MINRTAQIFFPGGKVEIFEEGKNCEQIIDVRGDFPILKVYMGKEIKIFKGVSYMISVDAANERREL